MKMLKENLIGLKRILLVLFAGTNILYTFGRGDRVLQTICIVGILAIALLLSFTLWEQKSGSRVQQAVIQGLYCGITVLIALSLSMVVGNIITCILIIAVTALYVCFLK